MGRYYASPAKRVCITCGRCSSRSVSSPAATHRVLTTERPVGRRTLLVVRRPAADEDRADRRNRVRRRRSTRLPSIAGSFERGAGGKKRRSAPPQSSATRGSSLVDVSAQRASRRIGRALAVRASRTASPTATARVFKRESVRRPPRREERGAAEVVPAQSHLSVSGTSWTGRRGDSRTSRSWTFPRYFKDRPSLDESPSVPRGLARRILRGRRLRRGGRHRHAQFGATATTSSSCVLSALRSASVPTASRRSDASGIPDGRSPAIFIASTSSAKTSSRTSSCSREHRRRDSSESQKQFDPTRLGRAVGRADRPRRRGVLRGRRRTTHAFALEDNILTGTASAADASGDAITFVREVEHLDFVDAVERLASRAGITLALRRQERRQGPHAQAAVVGGGGGRDRVLPRPAARSATTARTHAATCVPAGSTVTRRVSSSSAGRPTTGTGSASTSSSEKFARDDIEGAGLAFVNKANKLQDQFRGRLMFPIYDQRGDAVGFGGRAARRRAARSTRTRPRRRSTRRAGCSTGSTGRRARSSVVVRSSSARATPT